MSVLPISTKRLRLLERSDRLASTNSPTSELRTTSAPPTAWNGATKLRSRELATCFTPIDRTASHFDELAVAKHVGANPVSQLDGRHPDPAGMGRVHHEPLAALQLRDIV